MDNETFNKLMDYLRKLICYQKKNKPSKKKFTFIYYGSEPLMSKDFFIKRAFAKQIILFKSFLSNFLNDFLG